MNRAPTPLPPLQTLRAFESASRLASFTAAARELNVTQGAISRQIRYLEQRLGVQLFLRVDRGVRATAAGVRFADAVRDALTNLAQATDELVGGSRGHTVTVGATSAVATLWLMPRLTGIRQREPELDIRVLASDRDPERSSADVDIVIDYARRTPENPAARYLFREEVLAVCSPNYLNTHRAPRGPQDLLSETLLQLDDTHSEWMGWTEWLRSLSIDTSATRRPVRINNYPALLQAAIAAQGVALGWRHLIDEFLASGTLIPTISERVLGPGAFWLTPTRPVADNGPVARLCDWLQGTAGDSAVA